MPLYKHQKYKYPKQLLCLLKLFIMERKMFFDAYPQIFANAKYLRAHMTKAELLLWDQIKNNKLGFKFRRQHPMLYYIVDFYCFPLKLVIELDGTIHNFRKAEDLERTKAIEEAGNRVIRFSNEIVINDMENVLKQIREIIEEQKIK